MTAGALSQLGVVVLLFLAVSPRPSSEEQLTGNASGLAWTAGVAFDPANCPCSTALQAHGEALPDLAALFERILKPADLAVVIGAFLYSSLRSCGFASVV